MAGNKIDTRLVVFSVRTHQLLPRHMFYAFPLSKVNIIYYFLRRSLHKKDDLPFGSRESAGAVQIREKNVES